MRWTRQLRAGQRSMARLMHAAQSFTEANLPDLRFELPAMPAMPGMPAQPFGEPSIPGLEEVASFGANPGALRMLVRPSAAHVGGARPGAPLLVVLHGCQQDAGRFARDAGFFALADRLGAALLLPQQQPANNHARCFTWFHAADTYRDQGEAASIASMVATATQRFRADPRRVFVAGLSAGGAMTACLLAAYPELFAAGAVVAGLPAGAAEGTAQALSRMRQAGPRRSPAAWADAARAAGANGDVSWPRLSVWRGDADRTVDPANGELLAQQWAALHGIGATRLGWGDAVELWTVPGLEHGFPVDPRRDGGGTPGPWVLDAALPAAEHIARFWNLLP
jgi:poly(hydroxyalkanoate) depolymerase family esterase